VITGTGKVGNIKEILDAMKIKEVSVETFNKKLCASVYTQIGVLEYNKRIDKVLDCNDFIKNPRIILVILSDLQKSQILL
jgi:hypothetical protein